MNKGKLKLFLTFGVVIFALALFIPIGVYASQDEKVTNDDLFSQSKVDLTEDETAYMKEHPTITIAADASWRPLEYMKDDQYTGVIAEILKKLEGYTGFRIKYEVMDTYSQALEAVQTGKADMISGLADDVDMANEYNVDLSKPYLTINSAVISKKELTNLYQSTQHRKIAVVAGDYANGEIGKKIKNAELIECSTNEECLEKVKSDEVDMAVVASYCAEYLMSIPAYSALHNHTMPDFSWQLAFGIHKGIDSRLLSILNKGIARMSDVDVNESVYQGIIDAEYDNDVVGFIYKHPILVISLILVVGIIFCTLVGIILFVKKKERMRKIEDGTRIKLALERTKLCIWEIDLATGKVLQVDNEHERHGFGDKREHVPESVIQAGEIHPEDVAIVRDVIKRVKNGEQDVQGCWRVKEQSKEGEGSSYWWEQVLFHVVFDKHHRPVKTIGVSEDVTKEKDAQKDSLTLVYNRSSFEEKASMVLNERRNSYLKCAFLILDLDGFKQINDTYGHGMGDRVLISVGATLNKTFRATDIVGRLGGDEFTAFMTSISQPSDAERKAEELVENISRIQEKEGYPFAISCSVGVVVASKGQEAFDTMYKKADTALYAAKRAGKNQYQMYE